MNEVNIAPSAWGGVGRAIGDRGLWRVVVFRSTRAGACEARCASARKRGPSRGEAPARHGEISEDSRGRRSENVFGAAARPGDRRSRLVESR